MRLRVLKMVQPAIAKSSVFRIVNFPIDINQPLENYRRKSDVLKTAKLLGEVLVNN